MDFKIYGIIPFIVVGDKTRMHFCIQKLLKNAINRAVDGETLIVNVKCRFNESQNIEYIFTEEAPELLQNSDEEDLKDYEKQFLVVEVCEENLFLTKK
jgi:hypothetical protein